MNNYTPKLSHAMKLTSILVRTVFAISGMLGFAAGWNWFTPDVSAMASAPVVIPTQTMIITPPPTITATSLPAVALVEIIPDTPLPVYIFVDAVPVEFPTQETITEPTADYSQWITPLETEIAPAIVPGPSSTVVELNPMSLDDAWDTVVSLGMDDRFPACAFPLTAPFITWDMALEASALQAAGRTYTEIKMNAANIAAIVARGGLFFPSSGVVQIDENIIPSLITPLYYNGSIRVCRDVNNKPNLSGAGIQEFLNLLAAGYIHE